MKYSEVILLVGLSIFAGVLLKDSFSLDYSSEGGFGPGFIPRNFAIATIALAMVLLAQTYRNYQTCGAEEPDKSSDKSFDLGQLVAPVATILLLLVATYFMEFGSVLAPLGVTITIVSAVFLKHSWIKSVILTAATLAVIYAIFSLWLNIPII